MLGESLFLLTSPPQAQTMKVSNSFPWHQNTILPILSTPTFLPSALQHTVCFLYFSLLHCSFAHSTIGFCLAQPLCPQDHYCVVEQCVVATKCNDDGDLLTSLTIPSPNRPRPLHINGTTQMSVKGVFAVGDGTDLRCMAAFEIKKPLAGEEEVLGT